MFRGGRVASFAFIAKGGHSDRMQRVSESPQFFHHNQTVCPITDFNLSRCENECLIDPCRGVSVPQETAQSNYQAPRAGHSLITEVGALSGESSRTETLYKTKIRAKSLFLYYFHISPYSCIIYG